MNLTSHLTTTGPKLGIVLAAGLTALLFSVETSAGPPGGGGVEPDADPLPESIELQGIVRDFRERRADQGHPDMERKPSAGFGLYCGNVTSTLNDEGNPGFTGLGFKVNSSWKDSSGRPICWALFDPSRGDSGGTHGVSDTGGITSASSFAMWFDDVPGVNMSSPLTVSLRLQEDGTYVFDDKEDPLYEQLDGFFPIEDQLFGNPGGSPDRNFHFTYEIHAEFVYDAGQPQVFEFIGDDDVWVYIDGRLVIDLGGVHSASNQYVDLSRLNLTDGEIYALDFFFAERHRTQSNFRIQTNLTLQSVELPSVTAAYD